MDKNIWVRACARVLCVVGLLGGVAIPENVRAEDAPATADACVSFSNEPGDKQILVRASNDCKRKLACGVDYTVRCTDTHGTQTLKLDKHAPFTLAPKGSVAVTLSAEACLQGWAIDDFSWSCA